MADREKVIRGFECCLRNDHKKCPYYSADILDTTCYTRLHTDALDMLKEQEPRVVTTADFENNPNLDDGYHLNVWEEYKDGARYGWNTINVNDVRAFTDLRRYWTSRPNEEQRKAVPWDAEP